MRKLSSFRKSFLSLTLVLAILLTAAAPALGAETVSDAASAIQLMKTEGSVSITNGSGRALSVRENMRLYNGYHAKTTEKSYAWVNLDSSKLIKLDEVSEAEVRKAGKKLEVLLNSGNLYFDVSEPLDQEESLNIRTSTMIVGIRGTCGWVKMLNAWHAQVYLLEGRVECSVTDPATGESRTTVLQGGEMAEFVVYPQGQTGERCDIIRQSYTEEHIDGFVLVELVKDRTLCEKIYADSSLDVLGHFDQSSAQKQLERDQAAMAETLREMEQALSTQDNRVSQDPVWGSGSKDSGGSRDDSSDSGSSSTGGGGSSGVAPEPASVTLTMPVTDMDVQQALNRPATQRVIVAPGTDPARNTLEVGINMTVDSGKTLTLNSGVPARVQGSLTVNGTADLGDSLTNDGTITVNSANTLRVAGRFVNNAGGTIANTASGRITAGLGLSSGGALSTAGQIEGPVSLTGGSFTITGGEVTSDQTATLSVSGGAALALAGGTVTNTGSGTAITLAAGLSFPAGFATDFRAKTAVVSSPVPSGYGPVPRSDGYYHLMQSETAGPFLVSGGKAGIDYDYGVSGGSGTLTVYRDTPLTISMAAGNDYTTDKIVIDDGVSANLTLAGVNISATEPYTTPFSIADDSTGDVTITLAAGTRNFLEAGQYAAAIQKNNLADAGSLTITGSGSLTATGGAGGTAIGGPIAESIGTMVVSGGEIVAIRGITASDFTMSGGSINGYIRTDNFTISGGEIVSDANIGYTVSVNQGGTIHLDGGTITNTCTSEASGDYGAIFITEFTSAIEGEIKTDIRGKKDGLIALCRLTPDTQYGPYIPDGYAVKGPRADGYYHLEPIASEFAVSGGTEGTDYRYDTASHTLHILTATPMTLSMAEGVAQTTTDSIFIDDGVSANLTLAGVTIDVSSQDACALHIGNGTDTPGTGNVKITLVGDNSLSSGEFHPGLNSIGAAQLTIDGTGTLTATGGTHSMSGDFFPGGPGIGGNNIIINGGTITAITGATDGTSFSIEADNFTVSGGTVNGDISTSSFDMSAGTVNGKVVNVSDSFTISGGTVNGSVTLMSGSNTTGQLTISGGEIVCSKNGSAVSVNAPAQMSFTGGTVTQIIEGTALRLYNSGGSDILTFPADCATVFRSTHSRVIDPLPDGWGVEQRNDGYYYLIPWSTTTLSSDGITAEAIQAALADSDEVYISGSSPVSLAGNLTIPAGKAVTLEGGTKLSIGESGVSAPTVTVNGRLDASECTNFDHSGFLRIGPEGTFLAAINFVNRGVIENDGNIVFPYTRSTVMLNGGKYSSVGEPCRVTNRGTIDFGGTDPSSSGILENSGTITGITRLILSGKTDITGGTITANSTGSVLELHYGASVTISGGTITQESASGHAIGWSGGTDGTLSVTGGEVRAKAPSLLWYNADVTDEKGYQALEMADGYYYLVKKEENP